MKRLVQPTYAGRTASMLFHIDHISLWNSIVASERHSASRHSLIGRFSDGCEQVSSESPIDVPPVYDSQHYPPHPLIYCPFMPYGQGMVYKPPHAWKNGHDDSTINYTPSNLRTI